MENSDLVATFCSVTGAQARTAEQLLEMFTGDMDRAMNYYFENPGLDSQAMTEEDARAAAAAFQEDEPAPAPAPAAHQSIDLTGEGIGRRGFRQPAARAHAVAPAAPIVQEPEDVDLTNMEEGEGEDPDAELRTLAAHRAAGMAAAQEAQRMMEGMQGMMGTMLSAQGMPPLPSMFPGLMSAGMGPPGRLPHGHPVQIDDDDDDDMPLPGRSSRGSGRRAGAGLEVRGIPVSRGVEGGGSSSSLQQQQVEDDEALARRLMQEEEQAMGPRMEPSRASLRSHDLLAQGGPSGYQSSGPSVSEQAPGLGAGVGSETGLGMEEDEHLGLGVDRHELEEARMIEAAMLGIPYEPRLPVRRAAAPAATRDPAVNEVRSLRWEQDQAFEESLAADRAKAETAAQVARAAEEAARQEQEAVQAAEREAAEKASALQALLARKAASLPPEPPAGQPGVVTVMVRMPDGSRLSRRFDCSSALQAVFDFIDVQHQAASLQPGSYHLVNSYPRKVFKPDAPGSLADAGINADTALFVDPTAA